MSDERQVAKLLESKFKQDAMWVRGVSFATVPNGTTVQDMKAPEFWANIATKVQARSRIEVEPEDGSFIAEFSVRAAGPNWVRVELIELHEFVSAESVMAKSKDFKVEWGGAHKWRVTRTSDKQPVKTGFATAELAAEWLAANQNAMTAA